MGWAKGPRKNLSERFWSKVKKAAPDECWLWTAATWTKMKYGQFRMGPVSAYAHRIAYELSTGPIPAGLMVLHKCDTPLCCNPDHLIVGDQFDNMKHMIERGRWRPPRNGTKRRIKPMVGHVHHPAHTCNHYQRKLFERVANGEDIYIRRETALMLMEKNLIKIVEVNGDFQYRVTDTAKAQFIKWLSAEDQASANAP